MRSLLYGFCFFIALGSNAQDKKLSLGIAAAPDYYTYSSVSSASAANSASGWLGYSAGLHVQHDGSRRISLGAGLGWAVKGYTFDYTGLSPIDPNDPAVPVRSVTTLRYLSVPLYLQYHFISREQLRVYAGVNFVSNLMVNASRKIEMADGSKTRTRLKDVPSISTYVPEARLSLGLRFSAGEKAFISLAPYAGIGLVALSEGLEKHFVTGGLVGFHYYLK